MQSKYSPDGSLDLSPDLISFLQSSPSRTDPVYMDEKGASRLTGYSTAYFRKHRLLRSGPPYRKIGRSVRYNVFELLRWIEGQARYPARSFDSGGVSTGNS